MAKDKKQSKSAEDILIELHSSNSIETKQEDEETETSKQLTLKEKSNKDDLKDLVSTEVTKEKNLTETDYLILEQHCLGVNEKVICDEFNITKGYLRSLFRNSNSSKFIEKWSQSTQQKVIAQSTANIANGMDLFTKQFNKAIEEGKEDLALRLMFGKLSGIEAIEKIHKMNGEQEEDTQAPIQNLFLNLQQR